MKLLVNGPCGCCREEPGCIHWLCYCSMLRDGSRYLNNGETLPVNRCLPTISGPPASVKVVSGTWVKTTDGIQTSGGDVIGPCTDELPPIERNGQIVVAVRWLPEAHGAVQVTFGGKWRFAVYRGTELCHGTYVIEKYVDGEWVVLEDHSPFVMPNGEVVTEFSCAVHQASNTVALTLRTTYLSDPTFPLLPPLRIERLHEWEHAPLPRQVQVAVSLFTGSVVLRSAYGETLYSAQDPECDELHSCFPIIHNPYCEWFSTDWVLRPDDVTKEQYNGPVLDCSFHSNWLSIRVPLDGTERKTLILNPQPLAWRGADYRDQDIHWHFVYFRSWHNVAAIFFNENGEGLGGFRVELCQHEQYPDNWYYKGGWCDGNGDWIGVPEPVMPFVSESAPTHCVMIILQNSRAPAREDIGYPFMSARIVLVMAGHPHAPRWCRDPIEGVAYVGLKAWKGPEAEDEVLWLSGYFCSRCVDHPGCPVSG